MLGRLRRQWDRREYRARDTFELAVLILAIVLWPAGYIALRHEDNQRKSDLIASCVRNSARTASDVNLNWLYYESEAELAAQSRDTRAVLRALAPFPPAQRAALLGLATGGQGHKVLLARAAADYSAAFVKAQSIDVTQAGLIKRSTVLGSGQTPYEWVIRAGFSCRRAFG